MVLLNERNRVGPNTSTRTKGTQVLFGFPRLVSGVTGNPMWIGDAEWLVADFGDAIPLVENDPIFDHYGKDLPGKQMFNNTFRSFLRCAQVGTIDSDWNNKN